MKLFDLPAELHLQVLSKLRPDDAIRFSQVNRRTRALVFHERSYWERQGRIPPMRSPRPRPTPPGQIFVNRRAQFTAPVQRFLHNLPPTGPHPNIFSRTDVAWLGVMGTSRDEIRRIQASMSTFGRPVAVDQLPGLAQLMQKSARKLKIEIPNAEAWDCLHRYASLLMRRTSQWKRATTMRENAKAELLVLNTAGGLRDLRAAWSQPQSPRTRHLQIVMSAVLSTYIKRAMLPDRFPDLFEDLREAFQIDLGAREAEVIAVSFFESMDRGGWRREAQLFAMSTFGAQHNLSIHQLGIDVFVQHACKRARAFGLRGGFGPPREDAEMALKMAAFVASVGGMRVPERAQRDVNSAAIAWVCSVPKDIDHVLWTLSCLQVERQTLSGSQLHALHRAAVDRAEATSGHQEQTQQLLRHAQSFWFGAMDALDK